MIGKTTATRGTDELEQRAEAGDAQAQYELWTALRTAQQDNAGVRNLHAVLCQWCHDCPENREEAVRWLRLAAKHGHAQAQYELSMVCRYSDDTQDENEDAEWLGALRAAAENGHRDAQYELADSYDDGYFVPLDYEEARKWYQKAAELGDDDAAYRLGVMHRDGIGAPVDSPEALKWFRESAEMGNCFAQYALGQMYLRGESVPQDLEEAARWMRRSAEQDYLRAQVALGLMCYHGQGMPQDYDEAARWLAGATQDGIIEDPHMWRCVGHMYANGLGFPHNHEKAVDAFRWAADHGDQEAEAALRELDSTGYVSPF